MSKSYYDLLEVSPRASFEVIQAAYRTLMRQFHPDRGGDGEVAKSLNDAFRVLSDKDLREKYDKERRETEKELGNYKVLNLIASGGFGSTYKAEHKRTGMLVCIKDGFKISPQAEQILVEETKAMWDLRHYALPAVRDLIKLDDGRMALVMSYIPGPTLEKLIEAHGRLDPEHVAWIADRSLNALKYIHYNGIIHGDVKPQNVIVQPDHQVVLVDFGLSLIKPQATSDAKGYTEHFAPPEQKAGLTLVPESDLYSLGMMMIYALGGGVEFVKRKEVPQDTPEALCDFIRRLIVRDVLARPNWQREDLCETIRLVRLQAFGREYSGMKPLPKV